jgi:hypothetical protein
MTVIEISLSGLQAQSSLEIPVGVKGLVHVELGEREDTTLEATVVRHHRTELGEFYGFRLTEPDEPWRRCVGALETSHVACEL